MSRTALIARRAALAAVLALLAGCATQPAPPATVAAARPVFPAFELAGRLSATDGERGASGRLDWIHTPSSDEWTVYNPLGQVAAQLVSTPLGAELRTAEGRAVQASDARELIPRLVGVPVPLDGLSHWVQASAPPGARVLALDAAGRPARISDEGWIIDYREYAGPEPTARPRRIDAHWGDAQLRLIIDEWTPLP